MTDWHREAELNAQRIIELEAETETLNARVAKLILDLKMVTGCIYHSELKEIVERNGFTY